MEARVLICQENGLKFESIRNGRWAIIIFNILLINIPEVSLNCSLYDF